jgi:cell pole-organizing protein PopZ
MSEAKSQQEPSMEEILASIRRIIAEDGDAAPPVAASEPEKAEVAPEPEPAREDILELTEIVQDEPAVVPEPEPELEPEPPIERPFPPQRLYEPEAMDDDDRIVSARPAAASTAAFASMTNRLRERRGGDVFLGNGALTLEDLARDLLKPMLQEWLDENLPSLVERLVREEIERLARDAL